MKNSNPLKKSVRLNPELTALLGTNELPRTEITKKLWVYIKSNGLQAKTENGPAENAGKYIVADEKLLSVFKKTKSTTKSGKMVDFTGMNHGETIHMMQLASVVSANIEA